MTSKFDSQVLDAIRSNFGSMMLRQLNKLYGFEVFAAIDRLKAARQIRVVPGVGARAYVTR